MALPAFFRNPGTGEVAVAQAPNPAIGVFLVATLLRLSPWDGRDAELLWLGRGALVVWGLDELLRGHSPFRRTLGALVLLWQLVVLAR